MVSGIINTAISFFSSKLSFVLKIEAMNLYLLDNHSVNFALSYLA